MKIEQNDITPETYQAIAAAVLEMLKPVLSCNGKQSGDDTIFDKKTLAAYLHISESNVSKMVMNKEIPHFKIHSGQSGGVRFTKSHIDKWIQRQSIPDINPFTGKIRP